VNPRAHDDLTKQCEEEKEKFSEFEKSEVKMREDLKHAKNKAKKLDKTVETERKKVGDGFLLMLYVALIKDAMPVSFRSALFTSYILTIFKQ